MAKKEIDPLQSLGFRYGFRHTTYCGAVQDVMNTMKAARVRKLLLELVDTKVELPKKLIVVRLATAWLLQREIKNRQTKGTSLLPYPEKLYTRAVNYGKRNAKHYK